MRYSRSQDVFVSLGGEGIKGANSFSFDSSYSSPKTEIIGKGLATRSYKGKNQSEGSISALILTAGNNLYNTFIENSGIITAGTMGSHLSNFSFTSGYINSYKLNGGISSPPSDSIEFVTYGEIASITEENEKDQLLADMVEESALGLRNKSVLIEGISALESGHIQSFEYSISTNWKPSYAMGSHLPVDVSSVAGFELSLSLDLIVGSDDRQNVSNSFEEAFVSGSSDLEIKIVQCEGGSDIVYHMPKARMESEGLTADVNGFLEGTINFRSFVNTLEELEE
jgi:hypothetical protein|tara:strand:- start:5527 stop:6375 length:849 start_codon:yes stop_codon:yes gene_type:complete